MAKAMRQEAFNGTKTLLWPGIDIDFSMGTTGRKTTPGSTRDAFTEALSAGV